MDNIYNITPNKYMLRNYNANNIVAICLIFLNKKFRNRGFLSRKYADDLHTFFDPIVQYIRYIYIDLNDNCINITANINKHKYGRGTRYILHL